MKPPVLVTGAAGYLGSLLFQRLRLEGYPTQGVVHRRSEARLNGRFKDLDLLKERKCEALLKTWSPRIVVHTAGLIHITQDSLDPREKELFQCNVEATRSILHAAASAGCELFVLLSTMCVYGPPRRKYVNEAHPLKPANFYGTTKVLAEQLVEAYARFTPMRGCVLRPTGFFGGRRKEGLVYRWVKESLERKTILVPRGLSLPWNLISVKDVVEAVLCVIRRKPKARYAVYNIGYEQPVCLKRLASEIIRSTGSRSRIRETHKGIDIPFAYDARRARKEIGWKPRPLKERLKEYVEEIKKGRS